MYLVSLVHNAMILTLSSCADAVAMVMNVKKHTAYIAATVGYITDHVKANSSVLTKAPVRKNMLDFFKHDLNVNKYYLAL